MANYYTVVTMVNPQESIDLNEAELELLGYLGFDIEDGYIYAQENSVCIDGLEDFAMYYGEDREEMESSEVYKLFNKISNGGEDLIEFDDVLVNYLKRINSDDYFQFSGASYCDKARADSAHGFAYHITKDGAESIHTNQWLSSKGQ